MRLAPMTFLNRVIMSIDQLLNIFLKQTLILPVCKHNGLYQKLYKFLSPLVTFSIYPRRHLILTAGQVPIICISLKEAWRGVLVLTKKGKRKALFFFGKIKQQ